jgi:hypothetical protein
MGTDTAKVTDYQRQQSAAFLIMIFSSQIGQLSAQRKTRSVKAKIAELSDTVEKLAKNMLVEGIFYEC